jgi:hypothetical protein
MKRNTRLMMIVLVTVLWFVAQPLVVQAKTNDYAPALSCSNPSPSEAWKCNVEQQILASTVRLKWLVMTKNADGSYNSVGSVGHATIMEGRYLVTHNHTGIVSLSNPKDGEIVEVAAYTVSGELIWEGPLAAITVAREEAETLVLDFGTYRGEGMFARRGMGSAGFRTWESLSLQPGMEVAQVDWDGAATHVDWTKIESVVTDNGTPRVELANFVARGASGGGLFLNGYHIANNWSQATTLDGNTGAVTRRYSVSALNSVQVAAANFTPSTNETADAADVPGNAVE